jgi:excisionase family DNA binding protein
MRGRKETDVTLLIQASSRSGPAIPGNFPRAMEVSGGQPRFLGLSTRNGPASRHARRRAPRGRIRRFVRGARTGNPRHGTSRRMDPSERRVFTTGEVAKLCNVTIGTVIRWFDAGDLKGYKIPGSRDRRIPRDALVEFLTKHGMPLGELASEPPRRKRLLIVDDEPAIVAMLASFFRSLALYEVETATNGYSAGALTATFQPDVLIIDYSLGDITGLDVAKTIRSNPTLAKTRILCMSGFVTAEESERLLAEGIDDFVKKPLDLMDMQQRVVRLLGLFDGSGH